jgi:predicted RNA-binding protein with PUA domain
MPERLALVNKHKGTDLASIDPETGEMQRLFDPRRDQWHEHFELQGAEILARTGVGRVTVRLLRLNRMERVREREIMVRGGLFSL